MKSIPVRMMRIAGLQGDDPMAEGTAERAMAASITEIYRSSNGDRWQLLQTRDPARMLVRHIPNSSSGGQTTDTVVTDFLSTNGPGPEYAALRRLLESTADEPGDPERLPES